MIKALLRITLLLLVGTGLILLVEHFDAQSQARQHNERVARQLEEIRGKLQQQFDQLVSNSEQLAGELSTTPGLLYRLQSHPIIQSLSPDPAELTLSFTREYTIEAAFPLEGNEAVLGIDYFLSPEFMASIRRAVAGRVTTIDSKVTLRQTGRQGIILRTPYFSAKEGYSGMVNSAADLQTLLRKAGWVPEEADFDLLIEAQGPLYKELDILGEPERFRRSPSGPRVKVPENGYWELRAQPHEQGYSTARSDFIRLTGATLLLVLIFYQLYKSGILAGQRSHRQGMALRTGVVLMVVLPIALLVGAVTWLSYSATQQAAERLMQQQASELARQLRARIESFFDAPRQAVFAIELFRNGIISLDEPQQMLSILLSQLRVQPQLTFLSVANTRGEYFAASRPPTGSDRNVRLQFATLETGRAMQVHWVVKGNQPSEQFIKGNPYFDARRTVWYQQATTHEGLRWYPVYRYTTMDERNQYNGLGIGVSSAVYDAQNRFLGVISADVALQQISDFLKHHTRNHEQLVFLAEENGKLMASSDDSLVHALEPEGDHRISMHNIDNPLIRAAAAAIAQDKSSAGNRFIQVGGKTHLLDWQTIRLPDGPHILLATLLPQSWLSGTATPLLRDVFYLTALFLTIGVLSILFLLTWLTHPLLRMEAWARQLGRGHWQAALPPSSPIWEINSLTRSLETMAGQLRSQSDELEQRVADRTRELAAANQKLAELSLTDALTGIANRRRFDEFIRREWQSALRSGNMMALLLLDVDNFKRYNDHYGHAAGDQVLVKVAQALSKQVRGSDLLCRYGGEEFAVVLVGADLPAAMETAERLRSTVYSLGIEHSQVDNDCLSVSIGVVAAAPAEIGHMQAFFAAADCALYRAKEQGRNRVCSQVLIKQSAPGEVS